MVFISTLNIETKTMFKKTTNLIILSPFRPIWIFSVEFRYYKSKITFENEKQIQLLLKNNRVAEIQAAKHV